MGWGWEEAPKVVEGGDGDEDENGDGDGEGKGGLRGEMEEEGEDGTGYRYGRAYGGRMDDGEEVEEVDEREEGALKRKGRDGEEDDDDEEEKGYTMDMMLKSLNVELGVVGFDRALQRWVD